MSKRNTSNLVAGLTSGGGLSRLNALAGNAAATKKPRHSDEAKSDEAGYAVYSPDVSYEVGDHVLMPLDVLAEHAWNPRFFFPESAFQELVRSLATTGLQTAIQVYPKNQEGKYVLKSGHRRLRAFRVLGYATIKVEVVAPTGDVLKDYRDAREINRMHRSHTHFDDAIRFKQFLDEKVVAEQKDLAVLLGITDAELSKHLSVGSLPLAALETMAENLPNFGLTSSYLLYRYWVKAEKDDDSLLKLVKRVIEGKISTRQLEQMIADQRSGQQDKRREHALSRASFKGFATGELKAFDGKLTLKLEKMGNDKRDVLFRKLLAVFEEVGLDVNGAPDSSQGKEPAESAT